MRLCSSSSWALTHAGQLAQVTRFHIHTSWLPNRLAPTPYNSVVVYIGNLIEIKHHPSRSSGNSVAAALLTGSGKLKVALTVYNLTKVVYPDGEGVWCD